MIHLSVDGSFSHRIMIIASAMFLGRRTQQQIHLYWKDPIKSGENYHQYFDPVDDIKLRQWFPKLQQVLQEQHPNIYLSSNQPIPTQHQDYYIDLPKNPITLPDFPNPIFYRTAPGNYLKSDYEKMLSKFVRKFRPIPSILKQLKYYESTIFRYPKKIRIGIYLTINSSYYPITDSIIKQIIDQFPDPQFQILFSSDIYFYQTEIKRKFKPRLNTLDQFRKTQENGQQFQLIEGYLFSTCQKIIALNLSNSPYLSWLLSPDTTQLQVIQITKD